MAGTKLTPRLTLAAVLGHAALAAAQQTEPRTAAHDPVVAKQGDTYYLFATGRGVTMQTSTDLIHWKRIGPVLDRLPAWVAETVPQARDCWAPDILLTDGQYRLYYSVSSFGSNRSAIGLATSPTLDPADPRYKWTDRGPVVQTQKSDDWNAIDSAAFVDAGGQHWMVVGSFWSGIKLFKLDNASGKVVAGDRPRSIAARSDNTAIEAAFVTQRDGFYYLWVSFDLCCQGSNSTYNVRVGRSKSPEGPYVDRDGKAMLEGGGSVVLRGYEAVRGPGHNAVLRDGATDYLVHHWYDATRRGRASLAVRPIVYDSDGWPLPGEPLGEPAPAHTSPAGEWLASTDFADARPLTLDAGGTVSGDRGHWTLDGRTLTLRRPDRAAPGGASVETVTLSADGNWYVGRNEKGLIVRGRRE